jgi:Lar family restriction alleviation protein
VTLLPCPFCGGEASYRDDGRWEKVYDEGGAIVDVDISSPCVFVIECSCGAQIVSDESEDAVRAAWNRRADARQHALKTGVCPMCEDCPDGCPVETPKDSRNIVTNADRIRGMSDEELAEFIDNIATTTIKGVYCHSLGKNGTEKRGCYSQDYREDCVECALDWLQKPVEVVNSD